MQHKEPIKGMNLSDVHRQNADIMTRHRLDDNGVETTSGKEHVQRPYTLSLSEGNSPVLRSASSCSSSDDNNMSPLNDNNQDSDKYSKPDMDVDKVPQASLVGRPDLLACSHDFRHDCVTPSFIMSDVTSSSLDSLKNESDSSSSSNFVSSALSSKV